MKFKTIVLCLTALLLISCNNEFKQTNDYIESHTIVMAMGASLMSPENNWFNDGCSMLECGAYNKAIQGTMPVDYAEKLWRNTYCTESEFDKTDILAIQFANAGDVFSCDSLKEISTDYTNEFSHSKTENQFKKYSNAQLLDYILKSWKEKCKRQQYNKNSKWFNVEGGKPFKVILVTHWHDARTTYNESIRKVAKKWNLPVCELDKNIGFTKEKPLADGTQVSIKYARDTEKIDNIIYGWHPLVGKEGSEIQARMANIFAETLIKSNYINKDKNQTN